MRVAANDSSRTKTTRVPSRLTLALKIVAAGITLAIYSAGLILIGLFLARSLQEAVPNRAAQLRLGDVPTRLVASGKNHFELFKRDEALERLHLDIKFKHLEKLRAKRLEAIDAGVLIASDDDFVPATIRHDGRSIKTRIRLKGDALDHLSGDKWSFRVKIKSGDQLFGMRRFSIQAPSVRDFQAEPIFLEHLRREGVLTPRFRFVDVSVNGNDIGVMAIEEHFSKELLESQKRRESVILRFDESAFWRNLSLNGTFGPYGNPHVSVLKPFRASKVSESKALKQDVAVAIGLMRGFMAGRLPAADVFDAELMARFMAVAEVWQTHHPLAWHNMRFYFNPLTVRLEPIGFDGNLQSIAMEPGLVATRGGFTPLLLADEAFRATFVRTLARVAGEMADGSVAKWARPLEAELIPQLQEGLEWIEPIRLDSLMRRAERLATIDDDHFDHFVSPLGDPEMQYPVPLRAFICGHCDVPRVELLNILPVPVEILSMDLVQKKKKKKPSRNLKHPKPRASFPFELRATQPMQAATSVYVEFDSTPKLDSFDIELVVRVSGQSEKHIIRALPYFEILEVSPRPKATLEEALTQHGFLRLSENGASLLAASGTWNVVGPLVIPTGLGLTLAAGTELRFEENGYLVASGPLRFEGTEEQPIRLTPRPGAETWGGIMAFRSEAPHEWRYTVIESTKGLALPGWRLTGGVTLRASRIKISHSKFIGNRSEDALNMVRSQFELEDVEFMDTASDALDADYSDGTIHGGLFSQIGGDGIDVSGARITVDGTRLIQIVDKAISVGEASDLTARNVRIEGVGTGAASKDASRFRFEDSFVTGAATAGVSVYTKKPEYGPAQAVLERIEMRDVGTDVLVQNGNFATVDGVVAAETIFDTDTLY